MRIKTLVRARRFTFLTTATCLAVLLSLLTPGPATADSGEGSSPCMSVVSRGSHWSTLILPKPATPTLPISSEIGFTDYAVDPDNPQTIFISSESSVRRSTDGGCSWTTVLDISQGSTTVAAFPCDGVARELRPWDLNSTCPDIYDIELTPKRIYAQMLYNVAVPLTLVGRAMFSLILVSEDGGDTWRILNSPVNATTPEVFYGLGHMVVAPSDPNTIFLERSALTNTSFFVSHDAGDTWERAHIPSPLDTGAASYLSAVLPNPEKPQEAAIFAYTLGENGSLYYSKDEAKTWEKLNMPAGARPPFSDASMYQAPGKLAQIAFIDYESKLFYSQDAGASWFAIPLPETGNAVNYANVAFGKKGRYLVAMDQASTIVRYDLKRSVGTLMRSDGAAQEALTYVPGDAFYVFDDCDGLAQGGLDGRACRMISRYTGTGV